LPAKKELLAHSGETGPTSNIGPIRSPEEISEILKDNEENSGYGYFELTDKKEKTKSFLYDDEPKDLTDETVEKVYGKEYQEMFKSSIRALDFLEKNGMSRDEIIALLIHEPLRSWPKVSKRVLEK